jgi:hypothetical protein
MLLSSAPTGSSTVTVTALAVDHCTGRAVEYGAPEARASRPAGCDLSRSMAELGAPGPPPSPQQDSRGAAAAEQDRYEQQVARATGDDAHLGAHWAYVRALNRDIHGP